MTTKSELPEPHLFKVLKAAGAAAGRTVGMAEGREKGRVQGIAEGRAEGIAEGKMEGIAEGERVKAITAARKLLEHGVAWGIITDSTGIRPADLKKTSKM